MFIIRKLHRLFRLYTFVLLCGIVMVGIDYDMRAKAVGQTIGTYEPSAYLATLQRRLGRPQSLQVSSDGRIRSPPRWMWRFAPCVALRWPRRR